MDKISFLKLLIVFVMAATFCGSCQSQNRVTECVRTEYRTRIDTFIQHDSVHVKDSIYTVIKGDTVTTERWHWRTRTEWLYDIKTDTLILTDTLRIEKTKGVSAWKKAEYGLWGFLIGILITILLFIAFKIKSFII